MAPLLIDGRDLLKLVFISAFVTVLVFIGGFLFGHQQAATFYQSGSEFQALSLPEKTYTVENSVDSQPPAVVEAGEEIDVDQPVNSEQVDKQMQKPELEIATTVAQVTFTPVGDAADSVDVAPALRVKHNDDVILAENKTAEKQNTGSPAVADETDKLTEVSIVSAFTSDELSKIKYSIQVGMYGRLINAENMMEMLLAQHYDAYVTDYINKKNEIRYNVRFGYFSDKKTAVEKLSKFKANKTGDGYLVRFTADNIVKIAGATVIEQTDVTPVRSDDKVEDVAPVVGPAVSTQDKISQIDVSSNILSAAGLTKTN